VDISLLISVLLVVLVVFLVLREVWATIIPSIAVPLSLVGTFGVMYLLGYSIDNLSLMALTISTGFVVDDAIVVIENITRYLEEGMKPYEAAMKGSKEIGFTVLSMSVSLIAVFIPILLMGGIIGKLFREFAVTLSVAIAVSLLVSLTTTPMLCARFLKERDESQHGRLYRLFENAFLWVQHEYNSALRWVLRHQWITLAVAVGCALLNIYLFKIVPKGFFPQQDTGRLGGQTIASQDISFPAMKEKQQQLAQTVLNDPAIATVTAFAGGGRGSNNQGFMFVSLKPRNERPGHVSADQVVNRLRGKLSGVPGARLFLQAQQDIQIGGRGSAAQYQYTLSSPDPDELNQWAPRLEARARSMPELRDVSTDQQTQGLSETLVIDRDTASRLGISAQDIDQVLYDAFGQRQVSTMYTGLNQYFVVMEVAPQYQLSPDSLNNIYIKTASQGAASSVPTLGATTPAPATTTAAAATSLPSAFPRSTPAAPAVFATSGGALVTTSSASSTVSSSTSNASSTSAPATGATVSPVPANIAAITAANDQSANSATNTSGTLSSIVSSSASSSGAASADATTSATSTANTGGATTAGASTTGATTAGATTTSTTTSGAMVPLSAFAHWEQKRTSLTVNHQGQYPAVTLTFNLAPNVALGDAVTALEKAQADMGMPSSIHATFQGTAQAFQESLKNEPYLILAALVAVYIVLGILYESLIHPLTILSTLPPAGVGAILALLITGQDLSIMGLIGILLLIGIVKKNAIMMIDFALQAERDEGLPPVEAIYQACLLRFRPIMMTTLAAMFGGLPLAIGMGVGSELRQPLGITIVGGLLVSQALTLFTTPVVYLFFDKLQWRVMKLHRVGSELEESTGD
jgi:multidrug efflux pump subunit AcrB